MLHYLNNAGAGLMSDSTLRVVCDYLREEIEQGPYQAAQAAETRQEQFYARAAELIGASDSSEIAYMDSASRAWNMALHGSDLKKGDTVVTLASEFGTNLVTLFDYARRVGARVSVVSCTESGDFDLAEIEAELQKGARMLAISHAAAHAAIINPVYELGTIAHNHGALYIVDGCQAAGQLPIDVQRMRCDAYTATGRKWLRGPRGTGFLYVRRSSSLGASQLDLAAADLELSPERAVLGVSIRPDARQFELWERSIAGMFGLSAAIDEYLRSDLPQLAAEVNRRATPLRDSVANNTALQMLGARESDCGVIGFYVRDPLIEQRVREAFASAHIALSTMGDWDCPLHFPRNGVQSIFRLSPHYYTPSASVSTACDLLNSL